VPSTAKQLTIDDVHRLVRDRCLGTAGHGQVGVELEWVPLDAASPGRPVPSGPLHAAVEGATSLPHASAATLEPGGQIEVSTPPLAGPAAACRAADGDLAVLRRTLAGDGVALAGVGLSPVGDARRVLETPRYVAMETYFDRFGPAGRTMMCATASIQINLDFGPPAEAEARWRLAHLIGPTLAAAFANSPLAGGRPTGWRSTRLATWAAIDSSRTRPVPVEGSSGGLADDWVRYALDAKVMLIRTGEASYEPLAHDLTFARWMIEGHELGYPDADDLAYHLTTLFPPVRPRGWLELRMLDALPDPWWEVAVAVTTALLDDAESADLAEQAAAPAAGLWEEAARHGLGHPTLARSATACWDAALGGVERLGADPALLSACASFHDRYVALHRCPADDLLETWGAGADDDDLDAPEELSWT
jgi:glutamate--cysteine ligase